jgi:hypothetical protein
VPRTSRKVWATQQDPHFKKKISHVWWHTPIIPVLGRLRHKTQEVEAKFKEQPEILSKMLSQKMLNK